MREFFKWMGPVASFFYVMMIVTTIVAIAKGFLPLMLVALGSGLLAMLTLKN